MDFKIDAKTAMKKRDASKVLKAIAYACGLPLFVVFVFIGSIPFMNGSAYAATKYYGVIAAVAVWAIILVVQLFAALVTKNATGRALIAIIATLIVMIGGSMFFDSWAEKKLDAAREDYVRVSEGLEEDDEVDLAEYPTLDIKNYKYQVNSYVPWTKKSGLAASYAGEINEFLRVYNVGYSSEVKGSVNTDGSAYGAALEKEDGTLEYWFGETGAVYKENGLYADGYIYGLDVAMDILITYYETQKEFKAAGKDADEELDKALVKAAASKEWNDYKKSDEFKAAYGEDGIAEGYLITENRLDKIVKGLGNGLYESGAWDTVNGLKPILKSVAKVDLDALGINGDTIKNLSVDSVLTLINGFLGEDATPITVDSIMDLLEPFSNYEVSNVKPVMYFIEDETLRTYAYAKYFGEVHGGNVGSVLIPSKTVVDGKATYGNIGHITMSTSGLNYSENAFTLDRLYLLRANKEYAPTLYPLFAARRYAYIFAGIVALMFMIFYYMEMKVSFYGIRIQRMSTLGGAR